MAEDESRAASEPSERAAMSKEEREESLTQLVLRRSKLSPAEAALLRAEFPGIVKMYYDLVWSLLRRRSLAFHEAQDLLQEVFITLHNKILETGFVDSLPGMIRAITKGQILNHIRARRRSVVSIGLPSSGSEKPRSQPNAERDLRRQELARRIFSQLSPEHQEVIDLVVLNRLSYDEAADLLEIPKGTLKSRLMVAKRELLAAAERLLPPTAGPPDGYDNV